MHDNYTHCSNHIITIRSDYDENERLFSRKIALNKQSEVVLEVGSFKVNYTVKLSPRAEY